jgi:hypothetical protein
VWSADSPQSPPVEQKIGLEPLALELPLPTPKGTPTDLPTGPQIEPLSKEPRPPFLVPPGVQNVALGKPVTGSVRPFVGELKQITDGRKSPFDRDVVELNRGTQHVQVDLGEEHAIFAIVMWHDHRSIQVMRDVIVQISNDPEFKADVKTLFNNDLDDSSGLGFGTGREYFENYEGRIVDAGGAKARHVRCHTRGGTDSPFNAWQEIEVYALPAR